MKRRSKRNDKRRKKVKPPELKHSVGDECPYCGMDYGDTRTGLNFESVQEYIQDMHWSSRYVALGKMREIKQQVWETHLHYCEMIDSESETDDERTKEQKLLIANTKNGTLWKPSRRVGGNPRSTRNRKNKPSGTVA